MDKELSPSPSPMFNTSNWAYAPNHISITTTTNTNTNDNHPWRAHLHQGPCNSAIAPDTQEDLQNGSPSSSSDDTKSISRTVKKKGEKRIAQRRVALVTKSDVDNLKDGYRWRKYGQKGVKNSPFPRNYYKCTHSRCVVKKRVERSSADPSYVITTYVGQHSHPNPDSIRANHSTNHSRNYGLESTSFASNNPSHPFHFLDSSSSAFQQAHGIPMAQPMRTPYESHGIGEGLLQDMLPLGVRGVP